MPRRVVKPPHVRSFPDDLRPSHAASLLAHVGGSTVEIEDDKGERLTVEISSVGGVSPDSPLGRALLGAKPGDERNVDAPRGSWKARIIAIGGSRA